jgi:hypothetical protein
VHLGCSVIPSTVSISSAGCVLLFAGFPIRMSQSNRATRFAMASSESQSAFCTLLQRSAMMLLAPQLSAQPRAA